MQGCVSPGYVWFWGVLSWRLTSCDCGGVWEVRARSAEIVGDRATCSEALEAAGARCEWMAWPSPSAKHAAAPARDRQGRSARAGTHLPMGQ